MTNRRFFLLGAAVVLATPAIVRAESLMRIAAPRLIVPGPMTAFEVDVREAELISAIRARYDRVYAELYADLNKALEDQLIHGTSFTRTDVNGIPHHVPFLEAVRLIA